MAFCVTVWVDLIVFYQEFLKDKSKQGKKQNAVLVRVKAVRNNVAHKVGGIEKNEFNNMWNELEKCLQEVELDDSVSLNDLRKKVNRLTLSQFIYFT